MKATFNNSYTALQTSLIDRLAEIEQSDADACSSCGGEDCMCCEIYHDRQRWVDPDELFADDELGGYEPDEYCITCGRRSDRCACEQEDESEV